MEFIFKDKSLRECLNHFQSLVSIINKTLKLYKEKQVVEKVGFDGLPKNKKKGKNKFNCLTIKIHLKMNMLMKN